MLQHFDRQWMPALLVAVAIGLAGYFIGQGFQSIANKDRVVSVKGLSTQDVNADFVVWPLEMTISGNDLATLTAQLKSKEQIVRRFFLAKGFEEAEIKSGNTSIEDNWANYYERRPDNHYSIHSTMVISTHKVDLVIASQGTQAELLSQGVILNSYKWNTDYQFNGLNELKPVMIEEATKNARAVAQKFADDADCRLGSIMRANQGQFSVVSDEYQPWIKHVRVVTTVDYALD